MQEPGRFTGQVQATFRQLSASMSAMTRQIVRLVLVTVVVSTAVVAAMVSPAVAGRLAEPSVYKQ